MPISSPWLYFFAGISVVLAFVIWSIRRHRAPTLRVECETPISRLAPSIAGLTLGTALGGNRVQILENGAFFDALLDSIAGAKQTVHFETFLWKQGALGQRMADAMSAKARAGCKVRVMLDADGSKEAGKSAIAQMRSAGCRLEFFHKRAFVNIGVLNDRTHRKMLIVDGREAFVGGHCIVDTWLGDAQDKDHFADLSVRLHGPIVNSIQSAFSENWAGHTGELFLGDDVFVDFRHHQTRQKPSRPGGRAVHRPAGNHGAL